MEILSDNKWVRPRDKAKLRLLVYRTKGGIFQDMFIDGDRVMHTFSKRPYKLAQGCDGTIDGCVFALLYKYCQVKNLDLVEIYNKAYPEEKRDRMTLAGLNRIVRGGKKQGVEYPEIWNNEAFLGLIDSLHEINNHSLASLVEEKYGV